MQSTPMGLSLEKCVVIFFIFPSIVPQNSSLASKSLRFMGGRWLKNRFNTIHQVMEQKLRLRAALILD